MRLLGHPPSRRRAATPWTLLCLSLYTLLSDAKSAADYYVESLPGQPDGPLLNMHAGHIEVLPEHNGNMFFWHFENRHLANRHRTVIWMNGGPGCSSMDGALMEIGPYRMKDDAHLMYNDGAWDEFANLLFIDNPVGTGFSYVDSDSYDHELTEMASHMVIFLEKYFEIFPDHASNDLYISGESYAGQHIPYIAKAILDRNEKADKKWNLFGLLIGNGWVAPQEQSYAYLEYAYKTGMVIKDTPIAKQIEATQSQCIRDLEGDGKNAHVDYPNCEAILQEILRLTVKNKRCVNMYDIRLDDEYPSCGMNWPPDLQHITPYLRRKDVVDALHINPDKRSGWMECNGAVGGAFRARNSPPAITLLPDLLSKVPILLFSGEKDFICNHLGTESLIHNMEWNGGKGFEISPGTIAPRRDWTFEGEPAGIYQEARNLTYVLFYNASHMVPFDYPRRTRDMLDRFLHVDIGSIGGKPSDSRIDGEKGLETSVGGHPNSTAAEQVTKEKLDAERWAAYYRSGEVALVVVIILALGWGWYVWRDRRRRAGYQGLGVFGGSDARLMQESGMRRDVEAADFDESELDDLAARRPPGEGEPRYSLGGESSDEEDGAGGKRAANGGERGERDANGVANGRGGK